MSTPSDAENTVLGAALPDPIAQSELYLELLADFQAIGAIKKPLEREMALLERSKTFDEKHSLNLAFEDYVRFFEVYKADVSTPDFLERLVALTSRLDPLTRIFQSLASLAIVISAVQLATSFAEQKSQRINDRWMTIASDLNAGGGKREALEYLHDQGELLSNVALIDVQLSRLNLPERLPGEAERQYLPKEQQNQVRGARLQEANFAGSNIYQGYFQGANLYRSNFSSLPESQTNLDGVNFQEADLRQVSFRGASLKNACFQGANLEQADFTGVALQRTDFRGVRGLTRSQIEAAADGVESSLFDEALRQELRLVDPNTETEPASCRMQPRKLEWWRQWFGK